jgi:hypothetical protein
MCGTQECGNYVKSEFTDLYAVTTPDGYLLGATENDLGCSEQFWNQDWFNPGRMIYEGIQVLQNVPKDIADELCNMGTSNQFAYDDGYQAWQAVLANKHIEIKGDD